MMPMTGNLRKHTIAALIVPVALAAVLAIGVVAPRFATAAETNASKSEAALSGTVTSTEEGAMEGVLVSAKKMGSTISTTVVSDEKGRYQFPASRLEPGQYSLRVRATGYDVDDPGSIEIGSKPATADLKLHKAKDLAAQLTNAEWMMSMTATDAEKNSLLNCVQCHTLERILRSKHTQEEFARRFWTAWGATREPIFPAARAEAQSGPPARRTWRISRGRRGRSSLHFSPV